MFATVLLASNCSNFMFLKGSVAEQSHVASWCTLCMYDFAFMRLPFELFESTMITLAETGRNFRL